MERLTLYTKQGRRLPCFCFESVSSTNDVAKRIAREEGIERFAVTAAEQTGGHGRHGRAFLSSADRGLYLSFVYRAERENYASFGALSALAAAQLIEEFFGVHTTFKWPNDVVAEGGKICGILPESVVGTDGARYVVSGTGINLFYSREELGSLADVATSAVLCCKNEEIKRRLMQDKRATLRSAAVRLAELSSVVADRLEAGENLVPEYTARLETLGRRVRYTDASGQAREGMATGVAPDCSLIVRSGEREDRISWGEVTTQI